MTNNLSTLDQFELPSLPRAALQVINLIQNPDVDLQQLSKAVEVDPALAMRIVRLSNSSLFGLSREIASVRQAMVILGLRTVKVAALSFTLLQSLPSTGTNEILANCWKRILINALGCRLLAKLFKIDMEEAFLAGLLQDIGILVMASNVSEEYAAICEKSLSDNAPAMHEIEKEQFGIDHGELGAKLIERWSLPNTLAQAVREHSHLPVVKALEENRRDLVVLMAVAESVTDFLVNPTIKNLETFDAVSSCFGEYSSQVDKFVQHLEIQVTEMAELLDLNLPSGESYEKILQRARDLSKNMRVLHRDALPMRMRQEFAMAKRQQWYLSLALVQVNQAVKLEKENREHERVAIVDEVATALQEMSRDCDSLFRLSMDVFAILAPNTPQTGAESMCQRILNLMSSRSAEVDGRNLPLDITIATVTMEPDDDESDGDTLLRQSVANLKEARSTSKTICTTL
ncbi:MAG: HDOD domain-containing protein [Planctomycetota bacterium]